MINQPDEMKPKESINDMSIRKFIEESERDDQAIKESLTTEPPAKGSQQVEITMSHEIRASWILNKHFPEFSGNQHVLCHLAETLAYQDADQSVEVERLKG